VRICKVCSCLSPRSHRTPNAPGRGPAPAILPSSACPHSREAMLKQLLKDELEKVNQASKGNGDAAMPAAAVAAGSGAPPPKKISEKDKKEADRARAVAAAADAADARGKPMVLMTCTYFVDDVRRVLILLVSGVWLLGWIG